MKLIFMEKGFVLTIDAFLASVVLAAIIVLSIFYLSEINLSSWAKIEMKSLVYDEATVLEKSGTLENAIITSSSEGIINQMDSTPQSQCFEVTTFDQWGSIAIHAQKAGCTKNSGDIISNERIIAVRTATGTEYYTARTEGWLK